MKTNAERGTDFQNEERCHTLTKVTFSINHDLVVALGTRVRECYSYHNNLEHVYSTNANSRACICFIYRADNWTPVTLLKDEEVCSESKNRLF